MGIFCSKSSEQYENIPLDEIRSHTASRPSQSTAVSENCVHPYGWEDLHIAAAKADFKKLRNTIKTLKDPKQINALTKLSENALHILLEHGTHSKAFNVGWSNGQELQMSRIIGNENADMYKCANILIDNKIDINHPNFWNETPFTIAIKRRYFHIVALLLKQNAIDLDSNEDVILGKTARELITNILRNNIQSNEIKQIIAQVSKPGNEKTDPQIGRIREERQILFQFLKSGNEEKFLKFNEGNIENLANSIDGDNEENSSCTLLQYCFRRGWIEWYNEKIKPNESQSLCQDMNSNPMVTEFCHNSLAKCIQHLLINGADVNFKLNKFQKDKTVLEVAIMKGYYPFVCLILGRPEFKLNEDIILPLADALIYLLKKESNVDVVNYTLSIVLNKMLEMNLKKLNAEFEKKIKSIFENRDKKISKDNILLFLKISNFMCWKSEHGNSVLEEIDQDILIEHLDSCVEQKSDDITINCRSFIKDKSMHPMFQSCLNSKKLKQLLNHVVFKYLISKHWEAQQFKLGQWGIQYFYLNFYFYIFFYLILHVHILLQFNNTFNPYTLGLYILCLIIFIVKEGFQLTGNWSKYWKIRSNYFEFIFLIFAIIPLLYTQRPNSDIFKVLCISNANVVLLVLILDVPRCSQYIIILKTITYYVRYAGFFFIQFIAFAICFYILFSDKDQVWYKDIPDKIFETIILFTGSLDYMETHWIFDNKSTELNNVTNSTNSTNTSEQLTDIDINIFFSKLFFTVFVFFMTIILNNLLIGLLVVDLDKVKKQVPFIEQEKKISCVLRIDNFLELVKILNYKKFKVSKKVTITNDCKLLSEEEKRNLVSISKNLVKQSNDLEKLYEHITKKLK